MAINITVQKVGSGQERIKGIISNKLIRTEIQAIQVGKQALWDWYYRYKTYTLNVPYRGIMDGDVVEFSCTRPEINAKYKVSSVTITGSLKAGISVNLSVMGEYHDPAT